MVRNPEDRFSRLAANITNKHKLIKLLCFGINSHPTRSPEYELCPEKTCFFTDAKPKTHIVPIWPLGRGGEAGRCFQAFIFFFSRKAVLSRENRIYPVLDIFSGKIQSWNFFLHGILVCLYCF